MRFVIQRGATRTVTAVEEVVQRRSGKQLLAMVEAALWVLRAVHCPTPAPVGRIAGRLCADRIFHTPAPVAEPSSSFMAEAASDRLIFNGKPLLRTFA